MCGAMQSFRGAATSVHLCFLRWVRASMLRSLARSHTRRRRKDFLSACYVAPTNVPLGIPSMQLSCQDKNTLQNPKFDPILDPILFLLALDNLPLQSQNQTWPDFVNLFPRKIPMAKPNLAGFLQSSPNQKNCNGKGKPKLHLIPP